jgi:hypothetical protein
MSQQGAIISISAPGDVFGAITAVANAVSSVAQAVVAVAQDQSPEGLEAKRALNVVMAPLVAIAGLLDKALGIKTGAV